MFACHVRKVVFVCGEQVNVNQWLLVVTNRDQPKALEFCKMYVQCGGAMGIGVAQPVIVTLPSDRTEDYLKAIRSRLNPQVHNCWLWQQLLCWAVLAVGLSAVYLGYFVCCYGCDYCVMWKFQDLSPCCKNKWSYFDPIKVQWQKVTLLRLAFLFYGNDISVLHIA